MHERHTEAMGSIQIRDVPADVHEVLRRRADAEGQSLQEYLLAILMHQARRPTIHEWVTSVRSDMKSHPGAYARVDPDDILRGIREDRDSH